MFSNLSEYCNVRVNNLSFLNRVKTYFLIEGYFNTFTALKNVSTYNIVLFRIGLLIQFFF